MSRTPYEALQTPHRDVLGEGPWWDAATDVLCWVDIQGRQVRRARLDGGDYTTVTLPTEVGFAVMASDDEMVVGLRDGLHRLDLSSGATTPLATLDHDARTHRVNDGKTDPQGRVWFGTMRIDESAPTGALYRYDLDGLHHVLDGVTISNGLGWSPDRQVMYYTDSPTRQILAFDLDEGAAGLSGRRVFAEDPEGQVPDGLTVDVEGCVWGAKWDGGAVVRYAPDGREIARVELPVARVTSCAFVGERRDVLAVTTARTPGKDEPLAGRVLLVDVRVAGPAEARAQLPPPLS